MRLLAPVPPVQSAGERLVPAVAMRVALAAVGIGLSLVAYRPDAALAVGLVIAIAAAVAPRLMLAWLLILFLAAGRLAHHPHLGWRVLVLLAGLHLLHVLGMLALELPWRSWIDPAVLTAPLRRWAAIELPCQLIAVVALLTLAPGHAGHRPVAAAALGVVGALAIAAIGALLVRPRAR